MLEIAAAIELLHNASLLHDDILDRHDSRRGERTIRATHGDSFALLTGDAAVGIAFSLLSEIQPQLCADAATALGAAWLRMTEGQMMDEPDTWARIGEAEWLSHWACMSRSKLALGNVAGPLAAQVCGMSRVVGQVRDLHDDFSIVSQIINDLGDLERLSGFHVVTTCRRVEASETSIKPTLARIWGRLSSVDGARDAGSRHANWRAASKWVMAETETALARLDVMALDASAARILKDFFSRPACEVQRIMRGLVDA